MNTDSTLIPFSDLQKLGRCPEALSVLLWLVENCAGDGTIATSIRTIAAGTGLTKNQVCKGLDFLKANRTSNKCPRFARKQRAMERRWLARQWGLSLTRNLKTRLRRTFLIGGFQEYPMHNGTRKNSFNKSSILTR